MGSTAILRFISAAAGLFFLSFGTFSHNQFQDDASSKVMFFIGFSLCVSVFVFTPEKCIVMLDKLSKMHFFVKALLKFLLMGLFSVLFFLIMYPRFKFHPKYSADQELEQGHGNLFDLCGVGSFSVLALVILWEIKHQELGLFEILLELTMDASMKITGLDGKPEVWYMVGAYVFCFLLLIVQSYRRRSVDHHETSQERTENDSAETDRRDSGGVPEEGLGGSLEGGIGGGVSLEAGIGVGVSLEGGIEVPEGQVQRWAEAMRDSDRRRRDSESINGGVTESRDGISDGQTIGDNESIRGVVPEEEGVVPDNESIRGRSQRVRQGEGLRGIVVRLDPIVKQLQ